MSRRVAIYCRGKAGQANRAAEEALRDVAFQEGWTVAGTFVDGAGPSKLEYERLWRAIAAHDFDIVAVPSFAAIADGVSRVPPDGRLPPCGRLPSCGLLPPGGLFIRGCP